MNKKSTKTIEKNQEEGVESISFVLTASIRKILWQSWEELKRAGLIPMLLVVIVLSAVIKIYVGDLCIDIFNLARWSGIRKIVYVFLVILFLTDFSAQFFNLKYFRDPESGDIDIIALWKNVFTNPLSGIILIKRILRSSAAGLPFL